MGVLRSSTALLLVTMSAASPASGQRLIAETTEGMRRVCVYESPQRVPARAGEEMNSLDVGLGEPCPQRHRQQAESETAIPLLATLKGQISEDGQTICVYSLLGKQYERPIRSGSPCPYTPHF